MSLLSISMSSAITGRTPRTAHAGRQRVRWAYLRYMWLVDHRDLQNMIRTEAFLCLWIVPWVLALWLCQVYWTWLWLHPSGPTSSRSQEEPLWGWCALALSGRCPFFRRLDVPAVTLWHWPHLVSHWYTRLLDLYTQECDRQLCPFPPKSSGNPSCQSACRPCRHGMCSSPTILCQSTWGIAAGTAARSQEPAASSSESDPCLGTLSIPWRDQGRQHRYLCSEDRWLSCCRWPQTPGRGTALPMSLWF